MEMTVFGDPNNFALIAASVRSWNEKPGAGNGIFHFVVDGRVFPRRARVSTLSADIGSLSPGNALVELPENSEVSSLDADDAFRFLLNGMLPYILMDEDEIPDDFQTDYTFQASTNNLEDENCFAFAVRVGNQVRVLAAEVVPDPCAEGKCLVDVSEAWIDLRELTEIIDIAKEALKNLSL